MLPLWRTSRHPQPVKQYCPDVINAKFILATGLFEGIMYLLGGGTARGGYFFFKIPQLSELTAIGGPAKSLGKGVF